MADTLRTFQGLQIGWIDLRGDLQGSGAGVGGVDVSRGGPSRRSAQDAGRFLPLLLAPGEELSPRRLTRTRLSSTRRTTMTLLPFSPRKELFFPFPPFCGFFFVLCFLQLLPSFLSCLSCLAVAQVAHVGMGQILTWNQNSEKELSISNDLPVFC